MDYCDNRSITEKKDNVVPVSHSYILGWQFSFENMNYFVFILN